MADIVQLKDDNGNVFYPETHEKAVVDSNGVNLQTKLASIISPSYVTAWDGVSTPVVADIPAGVTFTFGGQTYTGTLAASSSTLNKIYLVGDNNGNFDEYVTQLNGSTYAWVYLGNTEVILNNYSPDEEDITADEGNHLKFKDRDSGTNMLGYVILRNDKTFAEQVTKANTIYEVRYAFSLTNNFQIPSGCALNFQGGSIGGAYTLDLNDCQITGTNEWIGQTLTIAGKTSSPCYADWFVGDDATKIARAISAFSVVNLNARDYLINSPINISVPFALFGYALPENFGTRSQTRLVANAQIDCILNCTKGSTYLSCCIQNVSFTASSSYYSAVDGIRFSTPNGPSRPFDILNCGFKRLKRGVYVYGSNATYSTNLYNLNIKGCNMSLNQYAIYVGGRHGIGGLTVADSVVEQNTQGGIVVVDDSGDSYVAGMGGIEIRNCLLEGEPDPIRIRTDGSVVIADNYFERATGYTQDVTVYGGDSTSRANVKICGNYHSSNGVSGFTYILRNCDIFEFRDSGATSFNVSLSHCVVYGNLDSHNKFTSITDTMFADWGRELVEDTYVDFCSMKPNIIVNGKAPTLRAVDAWSAGDAYNNNTKTIAPGDYRLVCFVRNSYADNTMALTNTNSGGDDFEHSIINPYSNPSKVFKYVHDITVTVAISGTNKLRFGYRRRGGANTIMGSGLLWFTKGTSIPRYNIENIPVRSFELSDILNPSRYDTFYYSVTKSTVIYVIDAWKTLDGKTPALTSGTTAERPASLLATDAGFQYFDTDLSKYIVWNGSAWANLDGTALN